MRRINTSFAMVVFGCLAFRPVSAQVGKKGEPAKTTPPPAAKSNTATKKSTTPARSNNSKANRRGSSSNASGNTSNSKAVEIAYWESVKDSTNPEDFRAYLRKYPNGEFVDLARNRITSLEPDQTERPTTNNNPKPIGSAIGAILDKTAPPVSGGEFIIPDSTTLVAKLNNHLSTRNTMAGDRFTMTVIAPSQFEGATIEGSVSTVERAGRITGRAKMVLSFENIRLRDGRTYQYAGVAEAFRTPDSLPVQMEDGNPYIQGRNDLELGSATEVTIRTRRRELSVERTVQVPLGPEWTDTGVDVRRGQRVKVTASGTIFNGVFTFPPEGYSAVEQSAPLPRAKAGVLIGIVGSDMSAPIFELGSSREFSPDRDGRLYMMGNSGSTNRSARGAFTVNIKVE